MRCPQLWLWHEAARSEGRELVRSEEPLVRGSIAHAGLAHLYARQRAIQLGENPNEFYPPSIAMAIVAEKYGALGAELLPVADRVVRGYVARYATENYRVLGVEELVQTTFCGHPYTARVDWIYMDRAQKVWIVDHKCVSKLEGKVYRRYTMSGQILGLWHIGARAYGERFGGVQVNFLAVNPQSYDRVVPEPAPWMLQRFPAVVARAHEGIAGLQKKIAADPSFVAPATPSEHTCWPYSRPCEFFEACRWGGE
jgi:hypothetical protein